MSPARTRSTAADVVHPVVLPDRERRAGGQIFPSGSTTFLEGQNYAAFQLPSALLLAASFGSAALYLIEDIEGGYFDKLRAAPVSRTAIVFGRLSAEAAKSVVITCIMLLVSLPFGISIASGRWASCSSSR